MQNRSANPQQDRRVHKQWSQEEEQHQDDQDSNGNLVGLYKHLIKQNLPAGDCRDRSSVGKNEDRKQSVRLA